MGAAARALGNMGMNDLALVRPLETETKEAHLLAANAQQVLRQAKIYSDLAAAVQDVDLIIGTSARNRRFPIPTYSVRAAAAHILTDPAAKVAILFGSEDKGLTNEELSYCSMHIVIPSSSSYPVLNIAAAVLIVCYELYTAAQQSTDKEADEYSFHNPQRISPPANNADMEHFYEHLAEWIGMTRFFNPQNPTNVMHKLRHIFNRAQLRDNELRMLRGLITHSIRLFKNKQRREGVHGS